MNVNATTIWALSASAIALVLAGMMIGQKINSASASIAQAGPQATVPGAEPIEDNYQVPTWLSQAPMEWRSEHDGSRSGHAMRFDYERRLLLVDLCTHPGFFDTKNNLPVGQEGPQCDRLLTAQLLEFTDEGVIAQRKDGRMVNIETAPVTMNGVAKLNVSFDDHELLLIPGQTNDLVNEIANTPEMKAEFQQYFDFQQQQMKQQRAQMTAESHNGVPSFTLPAEVLEANEAVREADQIAIETN